ncbi:hypothetical protein FNH22_25995 [Fulvivirga sp. M361]|uniref:TDP-N-acetylfucosamine:lipid II N-acetylfucosaminyltransferase n=1 Tax=Fulvivirga sp. M361 TaxID=2594266 RepID=UPI00117AE6B6|nr:TDP-N-acetylfucosamine:lipid II N-acetylfucosaminyltransferase [Fulvivirga sp. M361]TRX50227.1 hypothetical protein FNH22_25995 [Fulvivirga sp. M361]
MNEYLHICGDEKFIDFAITQFNKNTFAKHTFYVVSDKRELEYITNVKQVSIKLADDIINELANNTPFNGVFFHYLDSDKLPILQAMPDNILKIWMFWGQDAQKIIYDRSYLFKTWLLSYKIFGLKEFLWPFVNPIRRSLFRYTSKWQVLNKIDYCVPVIKKEAELLKKKLKLSFDILSFTYGSLQENFGDSLHSSAIKGAGILIGNSSSLASNHIDTFDVVSNYLDTLEQVTVPLNYGNAKYADSIEKVGFKVFGEKFNPIRQYLPRDKYIEKMSTCRYFVFNHLRQQALGNIMLSLWMGGIVFMNSKSILYQHLKSKGFKIYNMNEIHHLLSWEGYTDDFFEQVKQHNRKLLDSEYGEKAVIDKTNMLLKCLDVGE